MSQNLKIGVFGLPRKINLKKPRPRNIINLRTAGNTRETLEVSRKKKKSYIRRTGMTIV